MEFRLLGPIEVVHDGRPVAIGGLRERQVLALLLLAPNRVVSAERLIDDLWGGSPPDGAVKALRVFVSRLRAALRAAGGTEMVHTRSPGYLIEVGPDDLDVARFETALARARTAVEAGDHAAAAAELRAGLSLWRGAALADLGDAPIARADVGRLEELRRSALERRIEADLACGRHADLVAELDVLTGEHPLRERLWTARMLALYRCGRQAEALAAYATVRALLADELGLDPGVELARLEAAVLRHDPGLEWRANRSTRAVPAAGPVPSGGASRAEETPASVPPAGASWRQSPAASSFAWRAPFVGRAPEREELRGLLDRAVAGRGALVLLGGEAGVGKTRLGQELAAEATRHGVRCAVGHCYEGAGEPYLPFVEILESALDGAPSPAAFRDVLGDEAPELARLLPRLRRLFPDLPVALDLPPEQERRHLFNGVREVLARAAAQVPAVLVLEDLHWADEPTLLLLEHLAARVRELPVLLVGTYRDNELEANPALARTIGNLARRNQLTRVSLRRLPSNEVGALLEGLSGRRAPQHLVKLIDAQTDGLPFFVEEVYKHLHEEGRLFGADGEFRADPGGEPDVPETLRLILGRRLEHLDVGTQRVLECAAVAGRAFDARQLGAIGGAASADLLDALERAEAARLVVPVSPDPTDARLMFAHELIRQTILSRLSRPRRQSLHLRAADALERAAGEGAPEIAARIVEHLLRAGPGADPDRLLEHTVAAGRHAMSTAGFEEALRHFEAALDLRASSGAVERARLWEDVALARRCLGRLTDASEAWAWAIDAHEEAGDATAMARACLQGAIDLCWDNRDHQGYELIARGLTVLRAAPADPALRARMLGLSATGGAWGGVLAWVDLEPLNRQALELAAGLEDPHVLGEVLNYDASTHVAFGWQARAADSALRSVELLRSVGDFWKATESYVFALYALLETGRFDAALGLAAEVDELGTRWGMSGASTVANWVRGLTALAVDGDLECWEAAARRAVEFPVGIDAEPISLSWLALARFLRGEWGEALRLANDGARHELTNRMHGLEVGPLLQIKAYLGDRRGVLDILERERDYLPRPGVPNGLGSWQFLGYAVEGFSVLGDRERCAGLHPAAAAFAASDFVLTVHQGRLAQRVAGMAAAAARRWDEAEAHFAAALRQAEELPHRFEFAETNRFLAAMLLDRGDKEGAARAAALAEARYRALGAPRHAALAAR
ncbi:MAG: BTAD domain-containing putative transcriptional regulator [Sporichthyaceae bacterium]